VTEPRAALAPLRTESAPANGGPTLHAWLTQQAPALPVVLLSQMGGERSLSDGRALLEALCVEARTALRDARREAGERRGAYRLLAADAYLTYACEAALASAEPEAGLLLVVQQVVEEAGEE
jgi:hypothetical protein